MQHPYIIAADQLSLHTFSSHSSLQALASYGLASHAQHMQLLECPGLVKAILRHLAAATPSLTQHTSASPPGFNADTVEAALEALTSLAISQQGLQVCGGAWRQFRGHAVLIEGGNTHTRQQCN